MSRRLRFIHIVFIAFLLPIISPAQYTISGKLGNYDSLWINELSLSVVNSLDEIYFASPDIIINKDSLDKQGNFTMTGNNLPDENRIYRLNLTNQKNRVMLSRQVSTSNFIFLILNNHSSVKITCNNFSKSSFEYTVEGSAENEALQQLELFISNLNKLQENPSATTTAGKEYATNKINSSLRGYCDTCKYPIVALMAINEIIDFEKDYQAHTDFYRRFLQKIKSTADAKSIYVAEFEKKLALLDNPPIAGTVKSEYWSNPLIYIEGAIIMLLLGYMRYLRTKKETTSSIEKPVDRAALYESLTKREKEILTLLIEDIQNKEIANKLNLEVSTIKTHVSNIYQKLAINNRNEVKAYEPYLKIKNGFGSPSSN